MQQLRFPQLIPPKPSTILLQDITELYMPGILNPMYFTICWQSSYFTSCMYDWFSSHKRLVKYQVVPFFSKQQKFHQSENVSSPETMQRHVLQVYRYLKVRWGQTEKFINQHTVSEQGRHLDLEMQVCSSSVCACHYTLSSPHVYICSQT